VTLCDLSYARNDAKPPRPENRPVKQFGEISLNKGIVATVGKFITEVTRFQLSLPGSLPPAAGRDTAGLSFAAWASARGLGGG